jgi:hypothetical protein
MSNTSISLTRFLIEEQRAGRINPDLRLLIEVVARACKTISIAVGKGALGGVLGDVASSSDASINVQGEAQKKLDVLSNEILLEANAWGGHLAGLASEEMDTSHPIPDKYPARQLPAAVRSAGRQLEHRRQRLGGHHLLGAALPGRRHQPGRCEISCSRAPPRSPPATASTAPARCWC